MRNSLAIVFLCVALWGGDATAQTNMRQPSDTELLAAYCLNIIPGQMQLQEALMRDLSPEQRGGALAEMQRMQDSVQRIRAYLVLRLRSVDATGLLIASRQAQHDWSEMSQLTERKTLSDDRALAFGEKFSRCKDAAFLPY